MISGRTKNVTKSGPSGPVFITNILKNTRKLWGASLLYFHIWESEIRICWRYVYLFVLRLGDLKFWTAKTWKFENWNSINYISGNLKMWTLENWKSENLEIEIAYRKIKNMKMCEVRKYSISTSMDCSWRNSLCRLFMNNRKYLLIILEIHRYLWISKDSPQISVEYPCIIHWYQWIMHR